MRIQCPFLVISQPCSSNLSEYTVPLSSNLSVHSTPFSSNPILLCTFDL